MLYFIVSSYFKGYTNFLFSIVSLLLSLLLAIWLYYGSYIFRRHYVSLSPCFMFSFAELIDFLCVIEILAQNKIVDFSILRSFLNGGFKQHPFTFGGFFLLFLFIGIMLCKPLSGIKNFFKTFIVCTFLAFGGGLLLLALFLILYYYIVFIIIIVMIVVIFLPTS